MDAEPFPTGGRRLVVYVIYDYRGGVEDYVAYALAALREHADRIFVVVNGTLTDAGRAVLAPLADDILVRENLGFDIWAHKAALDRLGTRIADFDEVVLTNDTWFGPVRPFGPVFDRMDAQPLHFWGMTDHARQEPNPFTGEGVLPYHLQSFWIAVRRAMFQSERWTRYWEDLPAMASYFDAVLQHEAVFTEHFAGRGYSAGVAFPSADYPTDHPALFNPTLLMADGCPLLKRRPFFHWPPFLDRHAVIGREILQSAVRDGYPAGTILRNLARTVPPKVVNTNLAMLEVLPDEDAATYDPARPFRIVAVVHVTSLADGKPLLDRLAGHAVPLDLVVTTPDRTLSARLEQSLAGLPSHVGRREVRVVRSEGRDMGALLRECRDVVLEDGYDLIVKIHDRTPSHRGRAASRYFRRYQIENVIGGPGYFRNLLALFQQERGLGLVFPPMIHIGYATVGEGWSRYRHRAHQVADRLGIRVPFDGVSPLAPFGAMFVARPDALRLLFVHDWKPADFGLGTRREPPLDRVVERLVTYAAAESGYHARTILNREHAAISHLSTEYKLDQLATTLPGYPVEQIQFLHRAGWAGAGGAPAFVRMYMRTNHPELMKRIEPAIRPVGRGARAVVRTIRNGVSLVRGGGRS